jgi:glutathione S-transferase
MKLYFSPGACSLSPHITLRESGLEFDLERVDLKTKKTVTGEDYLSINPKGSVPALLMNNNEILTEGPAIVQYIADLAPNAKLAPAASTYERYRLQEWLNFISTEIHKGFSPLFKGGSEEAKNTAIENLKKKFDLVEKHLSKSTHFILGDQFTVADAYLYTVLRWTNHFKIDLKDWPYIETYMATINAREGVQAALKAEEASKSG